MISIERINAALQTDPELGLLWRKTLSKKMKAGSVAGSPDHCGYWRVVVDGKRLQVSHVVFALTVGRWPIGEIDHINRIRGDNRPANLREATTAENCRNCGTKATNTSGYKGVYWHKKRQRWIAEVTHNYKQYRLGAFNHPGVAALIYATAASRLHGEFANFGGAA